MYFVKVGGPFVSEVVQEVQPVHQTCGKCVWSSHSGVWGLHIAAGQSGESKQASLIGSFFRSQYQSPLCSLQDAVNQIMETNLWLRHASVFYSLSQVISGAASLWPGASVCFRSGMTTNWDGSLWSMMGLNSFGCHRIRFGGQILFCTTSELKVLDLLHHSGIWMQNVSSRYVISFCCIFHLLTFSLKCCEGL